MLISILANAALEYIYLSIYLSQFIYIYIYIYIYYRIISIDILKWNYPNCEFMGQMSRVFANGPIDRGSIPGRVIPKTQKMVLDAVLLSTQHCRVRIKIKGE